MILAALGELGGEGVNEALAVGLLVVDGGHALDADTEEVLGRERTLDSVSGAGTEVVGVRPLLRCRVGTLGEARVRVGGRDLGDVRRGQDRDGRLRHRGVQRADHAENGVIGRELRGGVLAGLGLGLVVLGRHLELPAGDRVGVVGLLDGKGDGVLDAQAQGGQATGQRRDDADLHRLGASSGAAGAGVAASARGQGQGRDRKRHAQSNNGTLLHSSSCESCPAHPPDSATTAD